MQSFNQTFVADNPGTHYWHGHTSLDRMDGLQGLIGMLFHAEPWIYICRSVSTYNYIFLSLQSLKILTMPKNKL